MDCKPLISTPTNAKTPVLLTKACNSAEDSHIDSVSEDRSININIGQLAPAPTVPTALNESSTLALSDSKKYTVVVETATDWPAVGASLVVGAAIAWFAYKTQKSQIKSALANFRHDWHNDLRAKIAEFASKAALMRFHINNNANYMSSSDSDLIYSELILIQTTIELMLDTSKQYSKELTRIMEEVVIALLQSPDDVVVHLNNLNKKANEVLEHGWQKIRSDLGVGQTRRRWFGF
ncbi:hypothetical protein [Pseudomonas faucium]|uniref:hypothetical protein n=1 Tax=Pseudomonas faucium TaxID=2740518 RepID=UPI001F38F3B1|nr:hypothetical protein [Pseudomonas faucium]